MTGWQRLDEELDHWRAAGRTATMWLRDDDACAATDALARLVALCTLNHVPLALAVIPARLESTLEDALAGCTGVRVLQHGYAHINHASPGTRACELDGRRPRAEVLAELRDGRARLVDAFGERFVAALVPPWNRIDDALVGELAGAGFAALSTFGPRVGAFAAPGLRRCNAHVDLIAWRRGRVFVGFDAAVDRLVAHLRARRQGEADAGEPTGVLAHHLDLDAPAWQFLGDLLAHTARHRAVDWLDAADACTSGAAASPGAGARAAC